MYVSRVCWTGFICWVFVYQNFTELHLFIKVLQDWIYFFEFLLYLSCFYWVSFIYLSRFYRTEFIFSSFFFIYHAFTEFHSFIYQGFTAPCIDLVFLYQSVTQFIYLIVLLGRIYPFVKTLLNSCVIHVKFPCGNYTRPCPCKARFLYNTRPLNRHIFTLVCFATFCAYDCTMQNG